MPAAIPTEQAALKCVYLALMSLDPTGKGRKQLRKVGDVKSSASDPHQQSIGGSGRYLGDQRTPERVITRL